MGNTSEHDEPLARTPLYDLHVELGGKMVSFAGYEMPVQYPLGIMGEHNQTREAAGLFDVSHMGQAFLVGPDHETTASALEALVPSEIAGLAPGRVRYTNLLNDEGGIIDDLMVTRSAREEDDGRLYLVVNASRKDVDYAHMAARLSGGVTLQPVEDRALVAIQGPKAVDVMARLSPQADGLAFMAASSGEVAGIDCHLSRSGYTGEDGYEISVAADQAEDLARALLAEPEVEAIGLGARDSLRLEAGLCLYGHDIDETTSPIEAGLRWIINKRRREEGGFPGAERIQREIAEGTSRLRVGIRPSGRAPAREGTEVSHDGRVVGTVTSGGFGPTVGGPVAMGYVETSLADPGTAVDLIIRGKAHPAEIAAVPFAEHRYIRKQS